MRMATGLLVGLSVAIPTSAQAQRLEADGFIACALLEQIGSTDPGIGTSTLGLGGRGAQAKTGISRQLIATVQVTSCSAPASNVAGRAGLRARRERIWRRSASAHPRPHCTSSSGSTPPSWYGRPA